MAEIGKKISFAGVDNISRTSDSIKRSLTELHNANLKGTKDSNEALKSQNALLERQLRLLDLQRDKINEIMTKGLSAGKQDVIGRLTERFFPTPGAITPEQVQKYTQVSKQTVAELTTEKTTLNEKILAKLQEILDNDKLIHKETSTHHAKDDEERKRQDKEHVASFDKKIKEKDFEKITKEEITAKREEVDKQKEIREQLKGKEEQKAEGINLAGLVEKLIHGGPIGAAKTTAEGLGFGVKELGVIGAALGLTTFLYKKEKAYRQLEAGATTPEELARQYIEANPIGVELDLAGQRRHRAALTEWQRRGAFKTAAITGQRTGFISDKYSVALEELGISQAEAEATRADISRVRGKRISDEELYKSHYAEKVLGVDQGIITGLEKQVRFGGTGDMKELAEMIRTNLGGQVKINENLEAILSVGEQHLNVLGNVNQNLTARTIGGFVGEGSLLKNIQTIMPIIQGLDVGISKPGTTFAKAGAFAAASQLMPGATFSELSRVVEQGVFGPEGNALLNSTLDMIAAQTGGDKESMRMGLKARFPSLSWEQIYQLVDHWEKGGKRIELSKLVAGEDTAGLIKNVRDVEDIGRATIENEALRNKKGPGEKARQLAGGRFGTYVGGEQITPEQAQKLADDIMSGKILENKNLKDFNKQVTTSTGSMDNFTNAVDTATTKLEEFVGFEKEPPHKKDTGIYINE